MKRFRCVIKNSLLAALLALPGSVYSAPLERFKTVSQVERDLRSSDKVKFREDNGWLIAESGTQIWSFTVEPHPAPPAVVERSVYEENGTVGIRTRQICTASEQACLALKAGFVGLNEHISKAMSGNTVSDDALIRLPGFELRYDKEFGWLVGRRQAGLLVLKKNNPSKSASIVASVQLYRAKSYANLGDFLEAERDRRVKNHNSDPRVQDPVASEVLVRHDGADCVSYQYFYKDPGALMTGILILSFSFPGHGFLYLQTKLRL